MRAWLRSLFAPKSVSTGRKPSRARLGVESMEDRLVPSTLNWINRGQASDNFDAVFGAKASLARSVVDTAISEWQNTIVNFNQVGHPHPTNHTLDNNYIDVTIAMNTDDNSGGTAVTNTTATDPNGKPTAATMTINKYGLITKDSKEVITERQPWYLDSTLFSSAFTGTPTNAFAGYAQDGSPAANRWDLMELVAHELGHACGFYSGSQVNARCVDTGVPDVASGGGVGDYWLFTGTGGFRALLTAFDISAGDTKGGQHFSNGLATYQGVTYNGADDVMTPYTITGQRRIVSRNDAFVLRDAYGYTVNDPATYQYNGSGNTFYATLDGSTGKLTVRGRPDAPSNDTITIDTGMDVTGLVPRSYVSVSVGLGTPVPGTAYSGPYTAKFNLSAVTSIEVDPGSGGATVNLAHTPNVPLAVNSAGSVRVNLGTGGDVRGVAGPITVNSAPGFSSTLSGDDSADPTAHTITLRDASPDGSSGLSQITGLTPATITYQTDRSGGVTLKTGTGTNAVKLDATGVGGVSLEGHSSATTVRVGNLTTQNVRGSVSVTNPPSFTTIVVDDSTDTAARTVSLNTRAGNSEYGEVVGLLGNGASVYYKYADTAAVTVKAGLGAEVVNVVDVVRPVTVEGHSAATTVNVGKAGSVQGILNTLTVSNPPSYTTLNIDDSADPGARTASLGFGSLTGLAPGVINFSNLSALNVLGGSGTNAFTVTGTPVSWIPVQTTLTTGNGTNTVNVLATSSALNLVGNSPTTTVNVGNAGSVGNIRSDILVKNPYSYTTLNIDDSADTAANTVVISGGSVRGLAAGAINYVAGDLRALNVTGGTGTNTFTVSDTPYSYYAVTTLKTGSGTNTVNVAATTGALNVVSGSGASTVNVGNAGSVQGIRGAVTVSNPPTHSTLNIDDSADTVGRTVTVTPSGITGLAPAAINFVQNDLQGLNVRGGVGNDDFILAGVPYNPYLTCTLATGPGNDTLEVPNALSGRVSADGGTGSDTLDYGRNTGTVQANLPLGTATGISGGVTGFENVTGGRGDSLIVGGAAPGAVLRGGAGRNLIIDGYHPTSGSYASIYGGPTGDNLLIGGFTAYDRNPAALNALFTEWTRTDLTFDQRVAHLRAGGGLNGSYVLTSSTVSTANAHDTLVGATGSGSTAMTWYWFDPSSVAFSRPGDRVN